MGDSLQPGHLMVIFTIFLFPAVVVGVIPFWFICRKAGFSPALAFLNLVPFGVGTLVLVYLLAFAKWNVAPLPLSYAQPQTPPYRPPA